MPKLTRCSTCVDLFEHETQRDACCDACLKGMGPLRNNRRRCKRACDKPWDDKWRDHRCISRAKRYVKAKQCLDDMSTSHLVEKSACPDIRTTLKEEDGVKNINNTLDSCEEDLKKTATIAQAGKT